MLCLTCVVCGDGGGDACGTALTELARDNRATTARSRWYVYDCLAVAREVGLHSLLVVCVTAACVHCCDSVCSVVLQLLQCHGLTGLASFAVLYCRCCMVV